MQSKTLTKIILLLAILAIVAVWFLYDRRIERLQ